MANPSSQRLMSIDSAVQRLGHSRVKPAVYFSPMAQPTSNSPATTRTTQDISLAPGCGGRLPGYPGMLDLLRLPVNGPRSTAGRPGPSRRRSRSTPCRRILAEVGREKCVHLLVSSRQLGRYLEKRFHCGRQKLDRIRQGIGVQDGFACPQSFLLLSNDLQPVSSRGIIEIGRNTIESGLRQVQEMSEFVEPHMMTLGAMVEASLQSGHGNDHDAPRMGHAGRLVRSEERRVGKEGRSWRGEQHDDDTRAQMHR